MTGILPPSGQHPQPQTPWTPGCGGSVARPQRGAEPCEDPLSPAAPELQVPQHLQSQLAAGLRETRGDVHAGVHTRGSSSGVSVSPHCVARCGTQDSHLAARAGSERAGAGTRTVGGRGPARAAGRRAGRSRPVCGDRRTAQGHSLLPTCPRGAVALLVPVCPHMRHSVTTPLMLVLSQLGHTEPCDAVSRTPRLAPVCPCRVPAGLYTPRGHTPENCQAIPIILAQTCDAPSPG